MPPRRSAKKKAPEYSTIRIPTGSYDLAHELRSRLVVDGVTRLPAGLQSAIRSRGGAPTLGGIVQAGLLLLERELIARPK